LVLLTCAIGCSKAAYDIPIYSNNDNYYGVNLFVNASFGTPAQQAQLRLDLDEQGLSPQLTNKRTCDDGNFDPDESSTFVWISSDSYGVYGNDTIDLGSGLVSPNNKLYIRHKYCYEDDSYISLSRNQRYDDSYPSFIRDYLLGQKDAIAVLSFDQIGFNESLPISGTLTLAGKPANLCADDWVYVPVSNKYDYDDYWAAQIDQITVGKYSFAKPGYAKVALNDYNIYFSDPTFTNVMQALGVSTDGFISCDSKSNVTLTINGNDLILGPQHYLDYSTVPKYGECTCRIQFRDDDDYFFLPITFWRERCLLLDYKNAQIGVAVRLAT